MTAPVHAIILAAGQGTRMKSALPKVLHPIAGRPMLLRVIDAAAEAGIADSQVVLGHGNQTVRQHLLPSTHVVLQVEQLGTGHAVQQALPGLPDEALVVVLYGDVPLVSAATLRRLIDAAAFGLALVTAQVAQPQGYGRIVRDAAGEVQRIVEEKDASATERAITEINTGLLAAPVSSLRRWLSKVGNHNANREFYLTDVVAIAVAEGLQLSTVAASDAREVEGVNDPLQLANAERYWQRREAERLMRAGLYLSDPARFDLRGSLQFGRDVRLDIGVVIEGQVSLGDGVSIGPYTLLRNVKLGAGTRVESHCVLDGCSVGADARIGPYARLRPGAQLADEVHIGNFVEIKQSELGRGTKANHLAYIGDAKVGSKVNIGAGVITCNYDGANKHVTTIGNDVFVGSDTQLVAPVTVNDGATIAAGSTITREVPAGGLTVARARDQKTLAKWQRPRKTPK